MKAYLMHPDRDFDLQREPPANEAALTQDLELNTLLEAMALGDGFLFDMARRALLSSLTDPEAIVYRQRVLSDCLEQPAVVRALYGITIEALQAERTVWFGLSSSPDSTLSRSVRVLELFLGPLRRLRAVADEHGPRFRSDGFTRLFAMLQRELDDDYFQTIEDHLRTLRFRSGVLISVELGRGLKGVRHVVRTAPARNWLQRLSLAGRSGLSFQIPERDENGYRALSELRGKGINQLANTMAQSVDHILAFFAMLRTELAFYVGCLNLYERLAARSQPSCLPVPVSPGRPVLAARGLYDVCLMLRLDVPVVGNTVDADGRTLVMITGANQGGKSTFLRSLGLAHLMMQCGMFVPAESFRADVRDGLFTHYKREEDASMKHGKLDEELARMSAIAEQLTPNSILLCNESFAATNEREGSEIARQIIRALVEAGVKVCFVTHLFDLANGLYLTRPVEALFLRAERQPDGRRTFQLIEGEPLPTSFGQDSYERIFGMALDAAPAASDMGR